LIALDELLQRDLIRSTAIARQFRFRHPLIRHAVYASITGGRRLEAHARAVIVFGARGAGPMVCAPHVEQSASVGDEHAIELLIAAATAAAGRAPASSAHWWQAALRLVPEQGALSERRRKLLPMVAAALAAAGRSQDSHATWLQALQQTPSSDARGRVRAIAACAAVENALGYHERARRRLLDAREDCLPNTREAVLVELGLAAHAGFMNEPQQVCDSAQRAIEGARSLDDDMLQAAGASRLSMGRCDLGQTASAKDAYADAARLLSTLDETQAALRLDTLFFLAWTGWLLHSSEEAELRFAEGVAVSRASGRTHLLIELMSGRCLMLRRLGRLAEALAVGDEVLEAAQVTGSPFALAWAQMARCYALTASGQLGSAVSAGEEAVAAARTANISQPLCAAARVYGEALNEAGEHQRAIDVILDLHGGPDLPRWGLAARPAAYEVLVCADLALGHHAEADGWAGRSAAIAARTQLPIADAAADRSRAQVLLAQGDAARAASLADRSIASAEACDARFDAARARLLAGRAHAAAGNRERAAEQLRAAETRFAEFDAQRWRAQAIRELRRIGRRVHHSARRAIPGADGIAALSGRERDVARLVCQHRTNREIASQLFLSEKTVEAHMRNIFVKLGARTRGEVARALQPPG
ncbi:MAG: hypothetical protein QOJ63_1057, partial [Solirubrobacteraceae bacterium]|nr:hypothetical protein [Solirubrobacteraceae bacterium]